MVPPKEAVVYPLLKGPLLDPMSLDSFHPVSNLSFLGKVVKKVVTWQLQRTLNPEQIIWALFSQVSDWVMK